MRNPFRSTAVALVLLPLAAPGAAAAEWYATAKGAATGQGTRQSPWDLESALDGRQKIAPGDTLWIGGGTYKKPFELLGHGFKVRLAGRDGAPVQVRGVPGERVTLDGGLDVQPPSTHLWVRDLEITVSEPRPERPVPPDPTYKVVNRPWGGLNIGTGAHCKYINLVIHDNCQGVSLWKEATDSEIHGCLIYDNGWAGTDRGHGHAIYTQNDEGLKTISDCIMTGGYGYTLHAYGSSRADVNNYLVTGNICYNAGPFLIGSGKPSHGIRVFDNLLHGVRMRLGYDAPHNEDVELRGNLIINADLTINRYRKVVNEDNLILKETDPRPPGARVILRPNRYDPHRAHLALFNWDRKPTVPVNASPFLKPGDRFRLLNPRDFYGNPILTGSYNGKPIPIPVSGEFAAFVLKREQPGT